MICKSVLIGLTVLFATTTAQVRADNGDDKVVRGGGTSILTGGTGVPSFIPVLTKFAFHWRDGEGKFECLALASSAAAGTQGSGNFDTNAMYVTGKVTSTEIHGPHAIMKGTATVTGLGAGTNVPFTATAERGGPGTRLVLTISGLSFDEIVIDGMIKF